MRPRGTPLIGQRLGHYRILEKLGSGGMGEVYAAEDTRLGRKVALKILPGAMAADPERRNRFESEARAVAALNHPNIVTLYSVEEADGIFFLTMELVHGKTLAEIVSSQGLPLQHFFELALPLADAVAAAHAQGVTHRDLKPENIMVAGDRRLKILDFGLAKLRETARPIGAGSSLPTQSVTGEGRIVGTVAYMSPEQAEGKEVDHRSDIFSLGILLYQMVTGQRPFKGETVFSVISSILRDMPPSVTQVKAGLPRDLARIIQRCLAKDPTRRFQTALDLRNELEELKAELDSGEGSPAEVALRRSGRWNWLLAVVGLVAGGILVALLLRRQIGPERPATPEPVTGEFTQLTHDPGPENWPSLSPDGKSIIYSSRASGNWNIYWLRVGGQNPVNLTPDSPLDDIEPAFLPDGEMIAFRSDREGGGIFVMGATGESVRRLTNFGASPAWFLDGKSIAFGTEPVTDSQNRGTTSQLWRVELATGEKRKIFGGDAVEPSVSPHGRRIAYWAVSGGQRDVWTIPADGGTPFPVTHDPSTDWGPVWSPDGQFIYFSSDRGGVMNLWRIRVQEETGKVLGDPQPVTTGVVASVEHASFSVDSKKILYSAVVRSSNLQKLRFDPDRETVVGSPTWVTQGSAPLDWPAVSPDEQSIAYTTSRQQTNRLPRMASLEPIAFQPTRTLPGLVKA